MKNGSKSRAHKLVSHLLDATADLNKSKCRRLNFPAILCIAWALYGCLFKVELNPAVNIMSRLTLDHSNIDQRICDSFWTEEPWELLRGIKLPRKRKKEIIKTIIHLELWHLFLLISGSFYSCLWSEMTVHFICHDLNTVYDTVRHVFFDLIGILFSFKKGMQSKCAHVKGIEKRIDWCILMVNSWVNIQLPPSINDTLPTHIDMTTNSIERKFDMKIRARTHECRQCFQVKCF